MNPVLAKFFRFGLVGALCAVLFFAVNYALLDVAGLPLFSALVLTYAICFGIGYFLQRNVAFRATGNHRRSLPRYFALHLGGMVAVYFLTLWLKPLNDLGRFGPSLIATLLAGLASFCISLTWVFAPSAQSGPQTKVPAGRP